MTACNSDSGPITEQQGVPNYDVAKDFPLLWERAKLHDDRERLGGDRDPIGADTATRS